MAISKVTIDALVKMADALCLCAEDILSAKREMDGQLRSFIWDDSVGMAFSGKYEEDFKPLTDKLIPAIDNYVTYIDSLTESISEYDDTIIGAGIGAGMAFYLGRDSHGTYTTSPYDPELIADGDCFDKHITGTERARQCVNKWAEILGKKKGEHLYPTDIIPGTNKTMSEFDKLSKRELLDALKAGTGVDWRESKPNDNFRPYRDGAGNAAVWNPWEKIIIVNKDFLKDPNATNGDVIEAFFHEDRHRHQVDVQQSGCYAWLHGVPAYKSVSSPCVDEYIIENTGGKQMSPGCLTEVRDYETQFVERDANKAGREAWIYFKQMFSRSRK